MGNPAEVRRGPETVVADARRPEGAADEAWTPETAFADGQAALARGAWAQARHAFEAAAANGATAEVLEGLSWAAWWESDAEALFDARERAYRAYQERDDRLGAARMAMWLGADHADFRGEVAVAQGWHARARRLLDGLDPGAEHAWLYLHEAERRLSAAALADALALAREAADIARRLRRPELEMLGLATEGLVLVTGGRVDEGMPLLDEAAATALSGDIEDLVAASWSCCYVLYACEQAHDYDRASQWCTRVTDWSRREDIAFINRTCQAHYGGVLVWKGAWSEAEAELTQSASHLAVLRPPMAAEAMVRLAELRRRQGRLEEAETLFDEVAEHPLALLGQGEAYLDRGDAVGARERAEQYLRVIGRDSPAVRASGLDLLARAASSLGDLDIAATAAEQLAGLAEQVPTAPLQALARHAAGLAAAAQGDLDVARTALEDATRLFQSAGAPFEAARARIDLARLMFRLDRPRDGSREAQAAAVSLRRIGADGEAARADDLAASAQPSGADGPSPLTPREREVLQLVAAGHGDRGIAAELVLSEHTVHRHVANILTKLGTPSRTAAVAEALRNGLI